MYNAVEDFTVSDVSSHHPPRLSDELRSLWQLPYETTLTGLVKPEYVAMESYAGLVFPRYGGGVIRHVDLVPVDANLDGRWSGGSVLGGGWPWVPGLKLRCLRRFCPSRGPIGPRTIRSAYLSLCWPRICWAASGGVEAVVASPLALPVFVCWRRRSAVLSSLLVGLSSPLAGLSMASWRMPVGGIFPTSPRIPLRLSLWQGPTTWRFLHD